MHKSFVGLALATVVFMGSNANATSYMSFIVNGDSSHTMTQGDTLSFICDCGVGDSVYFEYFLDLNENHAIDTSDLFLASWYSVDGDTLNEMGTGDNNPVPDGVLHTKDARDGSAPATYCVRATDESSISAFSYLVVSAISTPLATVSGTVHLEGITGPDSKLQYIMIGGYKNTPSVESWGALTDNMGAYTINFGTTGQVFNIGTWTTPEGYSFDGGDTNLLVTGDITGIDFYFKQETVEENRSSNKPIFTLTPSLVSKEITIRYTILSNENVLLNLYDLTGKLVRTIENGTRSTGTYETGLSTNDLTSGIYFVTLSAGKYKQTQKLVLTK